MPLHYVTSFSSLLHGFLTHKITLFFLNRKYIVFG